MKKTLSILLVTATSLTSIGLVHAQGNTSGSGTTVAKATNERLAGLPTWAKGIKDLGGKRFAKLPVEFKVEKIAHGVTITKTSTDADVVKKLQERGAAESQFEAKRPDLKDVQVTVTNIDNGVQTTLTSTDADTVTKLQERPKPGRGHGPMDLQLKDVQVAVEKINNGVTIKHTSTDADTVKKLQEMEAKMQKHKDQLSPEAADANRPARPQLKDVQRTVTNLDNGVQITMTSTDADTVTKLQEQKDRPFMMPFHGPRGHRDEKPMDKETTQE